MSNLDKKEKPKVSGLNLTFDFSAPSSITRELKPTESSKSSTAKPGISDMYSLGRLFAFLIVENREIFYCLVFMSIPDASLCNTTRKLFESFPIVNLIKKMTHFNPDVRISIDDVSHELSSDHLELQVITRHMIFSMFTEIGLEDVLDEINLSLSISEEQVSIMLRER